MFGKTIKLYSAPLILSITLSIALVALKVEREALTIILIFAGSILGTFILDLDYIIQAVFVEPDHHLTGTIKEYIKHKDIFGLLVFLAHHRQDFTQRALNSALFQIILGALTIFVVTSTLNVFLKAMVLSIFLNSIYRFVEEYLSDESENWFWSISIDTKPLNVYIYLAVLLVSLAYSVYLF